MINDTNYLCLPNRPNLRVYLANYININGENIVRGDYYQWSYVGTRAILFQNPSQNRLNLWREDGLDLTDKLDLGRDLVNLPLPEDVILDGIIIPDYTYGGNAFGAYDIIALNEGLYKLPYLKRVSILTTIMILFNKNLRTPIRKIPINFFSGNLNKLINQIKIKQNTQPQVDGVLFRSKHEIYRYESFGENDRIRKLTISEF